MDKYTDIVKQFIETNNAKCLAINEILDLHGEIVLSNFTSRKKPNGKNNLSDRINYVSLSTKGMVSGGKIKVQVDLDEKQPVLTIYNIQTTLENFKPGRNKRMNEVVQYYLDHFSDVHHSSKFS